MHLFDYNDKLKKYENVNDIVDDYYINRLKLYDKRKDYQLKILRNEISFGISSRNMFILMLSKTFIAHAWFNRK